MPAASALRSSASRRPPCTLVRAALLPSLLALLCLGCGTDLPVSLESRGAIEQVFSENWPPRQQLLSAYDEGGLPAALAQYRQAVPAGPEPYWRVTPERPPAPQLEARASAIIEDGFVYSYHPPFPLHPPVNWSSDPFHDRTWRFWLNAWEPLDDVLAAHVATGSPRYLHFAETIACDWLRQEAAGRSFQEFAWYDMAVGLRALQFAYLVHAAARDPDTDDATLAELIAGAHSHGRHLLQPENFNSHTNHGLYQAAGLLALGKALPELRGSNEWRRVGEQRLRSMFLKSFSPEGVHLEHSPGYHFQMAQLLIALTDSGLAADPALLALRRKAEKALAWMVAPDGTIPTIGDSDPTLVRPGHLGLPSASIDPGLAYALTGAAAGSPPADSDQVFSGSGYAIARSGWPAQADQWSRASYLIFTAAFHSRTHKHADDLSFVWYDAGRWLLIDAGRYGYYYDDPKRVYCESTRAHNTVEVDGQDSSRRSSEAFGSAITDWGEQSGAYFVSAQILRRWPPLRQSRTLIFMPGKWVVVVDEFDALASHSYEQWFHFAPDLALWTDGDTAGANLGDGRSLYVVPLLSPHGTTAEAVRGQTEPVMQGWYSSGHRALGPNWALGYRAEATEAAFVTLLCLSTSKPVVSLDEGMVAPRAISLRWQADGRAEGFTLERSAPSARLEVVPSTPPRTP
ncbi:MAG: heparinase II/III family protein [Armatimonadota bacterium]